MGTSITVDYKKLVEMLPDEITYHKNQLKYNDDPNLMKMSHESHDGFEQKPLKPGKQMNQLKRNMMMSID